MTRQLIAGIGCRRDCHSEAIIRMFEHACQEAGCRASALAAPAFKADEPGLRLAAQQLGLPLILVEAGALRAVQARCPTRSARAHGATGFASVAEGSALAAAGAGGWLVLARTTGDGVTCALAEAAAS